MVTGSQSRVCEVAQRYLQEKVNFTRMVEEETRQIRWTAKLMKVCKLGREVIIVYECTSRSSNIHKSSENSRFLIRSNKSLVVNIFS